MDEDKLRLLSVTTHIPQRNLKMQASSTALTLRQYYPGGPASHIKDQGAAEPALASRLTSPTAACRTDE